MDSSSYNIKTLKSILAVIKPLNMNPPRYYFNRCNISPAVCPESPE